MFRFRTASLAVALSTAGLIASAPLAEAATVVPYGGVGQHATVMSNIYRARRRNTNAISHVQNSIRASQRRHY